MIGQWPFVQKINSIQKEKMRQQSTNSGRSSWSAFHPLPPPHPRMRGSVFRSCSVKREEPWLGMEGGGLSLSDRSSPVAKVTDVPPFGLRRASSTDFSTVSERVLGINPCRTVATFALQLDALSIRLDLIHLTLISEVNLERMWNRRSQGVVLQSSSRKRNQCFQPAQVKFWRCRDSSRFMTLWLKTWCALYRTLNGPISLKSYTKHTVYQRPKAPIPLITESSSRLLISFSTCL